MPSHLLCHAPRPSKSLCTKRGWSASIPRCAWAGGGYSACLGVALLMMPVPFVWKPCGNSFCRPNKIPVVLLAPCENLPLTCTFSVCGTRPLLDTRLLARHQILGACNACCVSWSGSMSRSSESHQCAKLPTHDACPLCHNVYSEWTILLSATLSACPPVWQRGLATLFRSSVHPPFLLHPRPLGTSGAHSPALGTRITANAIRVRGTNDTSQVRVFLSVKGLAMWIHCGSDLQSFLEFPWLIW